MANEPNPREAIGGNNPPPQYRFGDELRAELAEDFSYRTTRRDELIAGGLQWLKDHPELESDPQAGDLAGIIAQIQEEIKVVDAEREGVKAPYLSACGVVDGFFTGQIISKLEEARTRLNTVQTEYLAAKDRRLKREAEDAQRKAREEQDKARREKAEAERVKKEAEDAKRAAEAKIAEAQRKIDEAAAAGKNAPKAATKALEKAETVVAKIETVVAKADAKIESAEETETRADLRARRADLTVNASKADRTRVRGTVAQTALSTTWDFRVVDLGKVPAVYMTVNEAAVRAAIRGAHGLRNIPGLEIFETERAKNRRQ